MDWLLKFLIGVVIGCGLWTLGAIAHALLT